jgi:3-keto-5-aminohexanoate cleavage enzyme
MQNPLVITAAITGSATPGLDVQQIPLTIDAIVEASTSSWRSGAAIIHIHARDEHGTPTQDPEIFREIVQRIQNAGCDAVLNLSTGSAGGRADLDERIECLRLNPEMATLDCGSMNFGDDRVFNNPYSFLQRTAELMRRSDTLAEMEVFDSAMIENGRRLIGEGLIDGPGVWQLCLGLRGGAPADLHSLAYLVSRLPSGAYWSALGIGRHQLPTNLHAIAAGGHVRTGLEDNLYYHRGTPALSNAQLVERIVRLAREFGRPVATPAQARELLGLATTVGATITGPLSPDGSVKPGVGGSPGVGRSPDVGRSPGVGGSAPFQEVLRARTPTRARTRAAPFDLEG